MHLIWSPAEHLLSFMTFTYIIYGENFRKIEIILYFRDMVLGQIVALVMVKTCMKYRIEKYKGYDPI